MKLVTVETTLRPLEENWCRVDRKFNVGHFIVEPFGPTHPVVVLFGSITSLKSACRELYRHRERATLKFLRTGATISDEPLFTGNFGRR